MGFFKREGYSRPLPELLDGDDWEVRNSLDLKVAYVDFGKREFVVPFVGGNSGELVRAHEAMHVKISPRKHSHTDHDFVTFQAVEDTRVNQALRTAGIPTEKGRVYKNHELSKIFQDPEKSTPLRLGESVFATKGLAEEEDIRKIVTEVNDRGDKILEICDELYSKYFAENEGVDITPEEDRDKCIKELTERLKEISTDSEKEMDEKGSQSSGAKSIKNVTQSFKPGERDKSLEEMQIDLITSEEMEEIDDALPRHYMGEFWGENPPGEMKIETPKFDSVLKFKGVKSIKKTASDEGVIPSRMHRYATDMRVFSRDGRRRTNSAVLVDVSGSMSLSHEQIMEIVKLSPEGIVAIYSASRDRGILRVVAEKGRIYSKLKEGMGGSNVIDYPALQWLAERKEKHKLWVSDGQVTGVYDSFLEAIYIRKIVRLVRDKKIIRVDGVKDLIESGTLIDGRFDSGKEVAERMAARAKEL